MGQAGVKHKSFGFAEAVHDAVQKADEEGGVEAHGARRVKQHHKPQRLDLASAPGEVDQSAAVRDIAMDGAPQIEAAAVAPDLLAPNKPSAHSTSEPRGERVRRRYVVRVGDVAQIGCRQGLGARRALATAAAVGMLGPLIAARPRCDACG